MRSIIIAVLLLLMVSGQVNAQAIMITGPNRAALLEDRTYDITWFASGVDKVSIRAYGTNTPVGGQSRGDFSIPIADSIPASQGSVKWQVPSIDSISFTVEVKANNQPPGSDIIATQTFGFRPAVMAGKIAAGIYLDLHERTHQRLYLQKAGKIVRAYLSTSSANYLWLPSNSSLQTPHDHAGVFRILGKEPLHWSRLFDVPMPWAMRYTGGHFIHATSPGEYEFLGTPASSGCNRLHYDDARALYSITPIGTRVEIIGPNGAVNSSK